jgi:hypothetical protein
MRRFGPRWNAVKLTAKKVCNLKPLGRTSGDISTLVSDHYTTLIFRGEHRAQSGG